MIRYYNRITGYYNKVLQSNSKELNPKPLNTEAKKTHHNPNP